MRVALIDCIERSLSDNLLFESILNQYSGTHPSAESSYQLYSQCDHVNQFVVLLNELLQGQDDLEGPALRFLASVFLSKSIIYSFVLMFIGIRPS